MNHETALLWGKSHFFNEQTFPLDHLTTVNTLDQLAHTRLSAVADRSAPLCGTPFIWRTPRGASSVPTSDSCYEYSECAGKPVRRNFLLIFQAITKSH